MKNNTEPLYLVTGCDDDNSTIKVNGELYVKAGGKFSHIVTFSLDTSHTMCGNTIEINGCTYEKYKNE